MPGKSSAEYKAAAFPQAAHEDLKENTPLLTAGDAPLYGADPALGGMRTDGPDDQFKSSRYFFLLGLGICGLQMAWATELSNGSPYLLSLGISKAWLALVWVAGPLSGVVVQPIVGSLSDNCKISWGRRRPYILAGAFLTVLSLLNLAWTREIVESLIELCNLPTSDRITSNVAIGFAVVWIYILDFSVNILQASIRAFIVDNAPTYQQDQANAWASRLVGVGNIMGYICGYIDLPALLPFLGGTQFQVLCAVACILLVATVSISCYSVPEVDPRLKWPTARQPRRSIGSFCKDCLTSYGRLAPQIRLICVTQFFNWMAWFPFLFYITTYIGQLRLDPIFRENPRLSPGDINREWEKATRFGTFALLVFAIVSFAGNSLIPLFIKPTYLTYETARDEEDGLTVRRLFASLHITGLTIRRAWFLSQVLFSACMLSTFFIRTATGAAVMTGVVGISWAMTLWAPFALISTEISKQETRHILHRTATMSGDPPDDPRMSIAAPADSEVTAMSAPDPDESSSPADEQAGVVLGLHNVAISAPQVLATVVASIVFKLLQRGRGVAGDDSVGWVLRLAGVAALASAWRTLKIKEEGTDRIEASRLVVLESEDYHGVGARSEA